MNYGLGLFVHSFIHPFKYVASGFCALGIVLCADDPEDCDTVPALKKKVEKASGLVEAIKLV